MDTAIQPNANQQPDTPTPDLDLIMKDSLTQFDINPPDTGNPSPPTAAPTAAPAPPTMPDQQDIVPAPAPPAQPPPAPDHPDTPRFKSLEEAEKGYKNLQAEFTRTTQRLKEFEGKENAQKQAEEEAAATQAVATAFEEFAVSRRVQLLDEIGALDPDAADYTQQVAKLQAKADKDIYLAGRQYAVKPPAASPPANPDAPKVTPEQVQDYVRSYIAQPKIGIKADDSYFWLVCASAPATDAKGNKLTLDQQITWAVQQTKSYHSRFTPPAAPANAINNAQNLEQPLGRTGNQAPPAPGTTQRKEPLSLSDAVDAAAQTRRL